MLLQAVPSWDLFLNSQSFFNGFYRVPNIFENLKEMSLFFQCRIFLKGTLHFVEHGTYHAYFGAVL